MALSPTPRWHEDEVPGTRWLRADLHLHTIDDPPRRRDAGYPETLDEPMVRRYARQFLDAAVDQRIEVLGLTPHSACITVGLSAAWTILDTWKRESHPSGVSYRDLIYAVFPGFEPSFGDGSKGVHLIFLFDPTIERDHYINAFTAIMDGRPAYKGHALDETKILPTDAFRKLDDPRFINGRYLVIAPHPLQENGLFGRNTDRAQDLVGPDKVLGYELRRNNSPEEDCDKSARLENVFKRGRALYHTSDANRLPVLGSAAAERELGHRCVLVKLASPSLEALRQAFLARDSRVRVAFERDASGATLSIRPDLPEPFPSGLGARPWIREVNVRGGTSFHRDQTFRFSPDLTCIIGGSMTGKSTLLDGLRYRLAGEKALPDPRSSLGAGILARAQGRFLSGNPVIDVQSPAGDITRPAAQRFRVRFFSQGELKTMADDEDAIEDLLFHLVPGRSAELRDERDELRRMDDRLEDLVGRLVGLHGQLVEAEQLFQRAKDARAAMERFAQAGTSALGAAQQDVARTKEAARAFAELRESARDLVAQLGSTPMPSFNAPSIAEALDGVGTEYTSAGLLESARDHAHGALADLEALAARTDAAHALARSLLDEATGRVQAALIAAGGSANDLNQFEAFARAAQNYESFEAAYKETARAVEDAFHEFRKLIEEREQLTARHRDSMTRVRRDIHDRFPDRIEIAVEPEGRRQSLAAWILARRAKGLTQWWNGPGSSTGKATAIRAVADLVGARKVEQAEAKAKGLGMSAAVARSFVELLAPLPVRLSALVLRSPDRYRITWLEHGVATDVDALSGGRKVAVLLSLLLESDDDTPLFIDQPEDELDNRFLNETIIPALRRLKGKRQVVFATHNANLVVNGDADQVIALEADAAHAKIYASGAIEDKAVREAIVRTLDGGRDAFRLRREKYGF